MCMFYVLDYLTGTNEIQYEGFTITSALSEAWGICGWPTLAASQMCG